MKLPGLIGLQSLSAPPFWPIGYTALQMITRWQKKIGVAHTDESSLPDAKALCETLFQINGTNPIYHEIEPAEDTGKSASKNPPPPPDSLARRINIGNDTQWTERPRRDIALNKAGLINPYRFSSVGFINPHHRHIFQEAWPALYDAVFGTGEADTDLEEMLVNSRPYTKIFYDIMKQNKDKVDFLLAGWLLKEE